MREGYGRRAMALFLAAILAASLAPLPARAATKPTFRTTKSVVYENSSTKGVYSYTVSGVRKGYSVRWGITGSGKKYVKLGEKVTKAAKTTVANKITVSTGGKSSARNKKFNVIAKVYDASGKRVAVLKDKPTIKVNAMKISIDPGKIAGNVESTEVEGSAEAVAVGETYSLKAAVTPSNATSKVYWTVTDADGEDHSDEITSSGKWTPKAGGEYTITATAKNSEKSQVLCEDSIQVRAGVYVTSLAQLAADQVRVTFSDSVKDKLSEDNVALEAGSGSSSVVPKSFAYDATGKTVTITTQTNFKDGVKYELAYEGAKKQFTASVGIPVSAKITVSEAQVETLTDVTYALYDENGIDVKNACDGSVEIDATVINGYLTADNQIYMTTPGKKASVTLKYTSADGETELTASKTVVCVEEKAQEAVSSNFTITPTEAAPEYAGADYEDVRSIALEEVGHAHFRALDAEGKEIAYDSVTFSCSNDDVLIVAEGGDVTPVKTGSAKVVVTVTKGDSKLTYSFGVTVREARKLSAVKLDASSVTMSNAYEADYQKVVGMTLYDQYGEKMALDDATVNVEASGPEADCVSFDAAVGGLVVRDTYLAVAGSTYSYKINVTLGERTASASLKLQVKSVPAQGTVTYSVEFSEEAIDTKVGKDTVEGRTLTVRLAQYRGGVFESYAQFDTATVRKSGKYFTEDLTEAGKGGSITLSPDGSALALTVLSLEQGGSSIGEARKAEPGSYTVSLRFLNEEGAEKMSAGTFKVEDTQEVPTVATERLTARERVANALDLARECLKVSDGEIIDCAVTGKSGTGSDVLVGAGEKINIKTIRVRTTVATGSEEVPKAYVYHTISVGKTLTNR